MEGSMGRSWLGKEIKYIKAGRGERTVVFVAGFAADDDVSSKILKEWCDKCVECDEKKQRLGDYGINQLFSRVTVYAVPRLNLDGGLIPSGIDAFGPFYMRTLRIRQSYPDRSWAANIRGVDLRKNYNGRWLDAKMDERKNGIFTPAPSGYCGEFPECEIESAVLCNFIRLLSPAAVFAFSAAKKAIYTDNIHKKDASDRAEIISKLKGIPVISDMSFTAATLPVWANRELDIPGFTVGIEDDTFSEYADILTLCAAV